MVAQIIVSLIAGLSLVLIVRGIEDVFPRQYRVNGRRNGWLRHGFAAQSSRYEALRYFETFMNGENGLISEARYFTGKRKKAKRCVQIERHLPEFSETLLMGLRAGLSFDRSFSLYHNRFDDELARLCAESQRRWENGLMSREASLVRLADESESELFVRLITNINRSMRLGSSLARTLEVFSSEARSCHKAKMEERIAKVAVKMMIPTTVCILPSMLILVLGPILLGMS